MITITDNAKKRIVDILQENNNQSSYIRVFIQGGGCAGWSYNFVIDEEVAEDDFAFPIAAEWDVIVDSMSMQYLDGAVIDYKEDLMESRFVIDNPNAQTSCGCGSSFSI